MKTRSLLLTLSLLGLYGCKEDLTDEKNTWAASTAAWANRLATVKQGHAALDARVKGLPSLEGTALQAEKVAVEKQVATGATALADAQAAFDNGKATIEPLLDQGRRLAVDVQLSTTLDTVNGILARAESLVSAANENASILMKKIEATHPTG